MPHTHKIIDTDLHFTIDPITRSITSNSEKVKLIQFDHNSEKFTFECPRTIEGHDMYQSDSIRIHYINLDKKTREDNRGVYLAGDLELDEDTDTINFSWLISRNATSLVGSLNFLIEFACFDAENDTVYSWHTDIFKGITVSTGMANDEEVINVYPDILERWKEDITSDLNVDKDWNENDSASSAYIKNRPFYEETKTLEFFPDLKPDGSDPITIVEDDNNKIYLVRLGDAIDLGLLLQTNSEHPPAYVTLYSHDPYHDETQTFKVTEVNINDNGDGSLSVEIVNDFAPCVITIFKTDSDIDFTGDGTLTHVPSGTYAHHELINFDDAWMEVSRIESITREPYKYTVISGPMKSFADYDALPDEFGYIENRPVYNYVTKPFVIATEIPDHGQSAAVVYTGGSLVEGETYTITTGGLDESLVWDGITDGKDIVYDQDGTTPVLVKISDESIGANNELNGCELVSDDKQYYITSKIQSSNNNSVDLFFELVDMQGESSDPLQFAAIIALRDYVDEVLGQFRKGIYLDVNMPSGTFTKHSSSAVAQLKNNNTEVTINGITLFSGLNSVNGDSIRSNSSPISRITITGPVRKVKKLPIDSVDINYNTFKQNLNITLDDIDDNYNGIDLFDYTTTWYKPTLYPFKIKPEYSLSAVADSVKYFASSNGRTVGRPIYSSYYSNIMLAESSSSGVALGYCAGNVGFFTPYSSNSEHPRLFGIGEPVGDYEAANKKYVDARIPAWDEVQNTYLIGAVKTNAATQTSSGYKYSSGYWNIGGAYYDQKSIPGNLASGDYDFIEAVITDDYNSTTGEFTQQHVTDITVTEVATNLISYSVEGQDNPIAYLAKEDLAYNSKYIRQGLYMHRALSGGKSRTVKFAVHKYHKISPNLLPLGDGLKVDGDNIVVDKASISNDNLFAVTFSADPNDDTKALCDKTLAQINQAFEDGKYIYCKIQGMALTGNLVSLSTDDAYFTMFNFKNPVQAFQFHMTASENTIGMLDEFSGYIGGKVQDYGYDYFVAVNTGQGFTEEEKAQARSNIDAISISDVTLNFTISLSANKKVSISIPRTEILSAIDAGKEVVGYWTETKTILNTTTNIQHKFSLISIEGEGSTRSLAFENCEQFYKSTLYLNGNDTISLVENEQLPHPLTKTDDMTQEVGMDDNGKLWTKPGDTIPTVTTEDNGKFLQVVNGAWAAVSIPNANGVNF